MPNGKTIRSSHAVHLNIEGLPRIATKAHALPGLQHALISIGQLCDHGCHATFTNDKCNIHRNDRLILTGPRDRQTGLWKIPLTTRRTHVAFSAYEQATQKELIECLHACCFSPPKSTFLKAIKNQHFTTWPGLTAETVNKHLQEPIATAKGHLNRARKNLRSTKNSTILEEDPPPDPIAQPTQHVMATLLCHDPKTHRVYSDLMGRFPTTSLNGMAHMILFYHYDHNYTSTFPLKTQSDADCLKAYETFCAECRQRGALPKLNIVDNEASKAVKRAILEQGVQHQLVPPDNHRVNAAERAIRTWKNHFIAGLATCDPAFPIALWDTLLPQAEITVNLLRQSRLNPKLSAHASFHGNYDFNRTPLAPPGTKALLFEDPTTRSSWAPHGREAWHTGPALEHHRSYKFHVPSTKGHRISDTAKFYPTKVNMPKTSSFDATIKAAQDLIVASSKPQPASPFTITNPTFQALQDLAAIFAKVTNKTIPEPKTTTVPVHTSHRCPTRNKVSVLTQKPPLTPHPEPRVAAPTPSTPLRAEPRVTLPDAPRTSNVTTPRSCAPSLHNNQTMSQLQDEALTEPWTYEQCAFAVLDADAGLAQNYTNNSSTTPKPAPPGPKPCAKN